MTRIYVAGHNGMVGSAIVRRLKARQESGETIELVTCTHAELDLTDQASVRNFFRMRSLMWRYWRRQRWGDIRQ